MKKNIILLLLDSMCEEDLKFIEKNKINFPGFSKFLGQNSIKYDNAFSVSSPTEPVMPTLFTGELPLNKKTYEFGIKNFRKDFFYTIKKNNYDFFILSNHSIISKMMGFTNKIVKLKLYCSIEHAWKYFQRIYCWGYLNNKDYEKYKDQSFKQKAYQFMTFFKDYLYEDKSWFSQSVNNLDRSKAHQIKKKLDKKIKILKKTSSKNINKEIKDIINNDFFSYVKENTLKDFLLSNLSKVFNDKKITWKYAKLDLFNFQFRFRNLVTNIDQILDRSLKIILKQKKKFFLFSHIMDLHHYNFSSNNLLLVKPSLKKLKNNHLYGRERELSLFYMDQQINDFIKNIPDEIKKRSCFVITSDHGTAVDENNEGPLNNKKLCGLFSKQFLKIPFMIYIPGLKSKKISRSLISTYNVFPIIFKNAKLRLEGYTKKLSEVENQKYILAEHTHRGGAYDNLRFGQVYNCIMTNKFKYILKSKIGRFDNSPKEKEILVKVNNDNKNLINDAKFFKETFIMKKILKKRQVDILNKSNHD